MVNPIKLMKFIEQLEGNPFDYKNPKHLNKLKNYSFFDDINPDGSVNQIPIMIKSGNKEAFEIDSVRKALQDAGFDGLLK